MPASRRQIFTAGAAVGIGVFATRAGAATFGNPDEPAQGIVNTQGNPRSAVDPNGVHPALDRRRRSSAVLGLV
jgi:oxalate decarboxylase